MAIIEKKMDENNNFIKNKETLNFDSWNLWLARKVKKINQLAMIWDWQPPKNRYNLDHLS